MLNEVLRNKGKGSQDSYNYKVKPFVGRRSNSSTISLHRQVIDFSIVIKLNFKTRTFLIETISTSTF